MPAGLMSIADVVLGAKVINEQLLSKLWLDSLIFIAVSGQRLKERRGEGQEIKITLSSHLSPPPSPTVHSNC